MTGLTIGCDPELFAFDQSAKSFVSCHPYLTGTKKEPTKVALGAIQLDGTSAEINIKPASTRVEFIRHISSVLHDTQKLLPSSFALTAVPSVTYPQKYYDELPSFTKESGCDPDYNAYTGDRNSHLIPDNTAFGGGHIHIGWEAYTKQAPALQELQAREMIKQMDAVVGLASLQWDKFQERRFAHGAAGNYRRKPYGVEYRSLSNAWLANIGLMEKVYDLTHLAASKYLEGKIVQNEFTSIEFDKIITFSDHEEAEKVHKDVMEYLNAA